MLLAADAENVLLSRRYRKIRGYSHSTRLFRGSADAWAALPQRLAGWTEHLASGSQSRRTRRPRSCARSAAAATAGGKSHKEKAKERRCCRRFQHLLLLVTDWTWSLELSHSVSGSEWRRPALPSLQHPTSPDPPPSIKAHQTYCGTPSAVRSFPFHLCKNTTWISTTIMMWNLGGFFLLL